MDTTITVNNTPGGKPDVQGNPPSSEAGLMDSGGDQKLLYYHHFNQSQDVLRNNTQISELEMNFEYNPFARVGGLSRSPTRVASPSLEVSSNTQPKQAMLQDNRDNRDSTNDQLRDELRKVNSALDESNKINNQMNQAMAWMQEHIKTLENEINVLKTKGFITQKKNNDSTVQKSTAFETNGASCSTQKDNNDSTVRKPPVHEYCTDEDELAEETGWIRAHNRRKKRKRNNTPTPPKAKGPDPKIIQKEPKKGPQPPPIVVDGVKSYDLLYEEIKTITTTDKFHTKLINGNTIKINLEDGETYRKMTQMLNEGKRSWHTFEDKQIRPIRVMAKNLHPTCKPEKIIADLKAKGFENVIEASIKLKARGKEPLNMFMLTFSADEDIQKIYQIKSILGCKVIIQPLRRSKLIPQCKQCQGYGHTQKYCNKEPRCVKCAGKHHTRECTKPKDVQPKCVHCGEDHPANYRGCSVAIELQNIKNRNVNAKNPKLIFNRQVSINNAKINKEVPKRKMPEAAQGELGKLSYAQVTQRGLHQHNGNKGNADPDGGIYQTLQLILNRLNTFDERLQKLEYSTKGAIPKHRNGQ